MEGDTPSPAGGALATPASPTGGEPAPAPELETPAIGEQPENPSPEGDDEPGEFEFGFKKYSNVPKSLRENVSKLNAEFTRTRQKEADRVRELDERESRIAQQLQATEAELSDRAQLQHVKSELKRFENYTWAHYQQHKQTDPAAAEDAWAYVQHLKGLQQETEGRISDASKKRTEAAQSETTKRAQQTFDWAQKNIKGWNHDVDTKVFAFAQAEGYTPEELTSRMSPRFYALLHKAMIGEATLKRSTAPGVSAPTPPSPTVVGGKTNPPASFDPAKSDMDDYVRARKAQIAAKR